MGIPEHLTCLLRNLYSGQEAMVRTSMDWFQVGKGVRQSCILSLCLFNFYAEYIMRNAGLDEAQAGIKIARRNINNPNRCRWHHPYSKKQRTKEPLDESERGEWKTGLKLSIEKPKIMASGSITSWHIDAEKSENSDRVYFLGLQNHCRLSLQPWN